MIPPPDGILYHCNPSFPQGCGVVQGTVVAEDMVGTKAVLADFEASSTNDKAAFGNDKAEDEDEEEEEEIAAWGSAVLGNMEGVINNLPEKLGSILTIMILFMEISPCTRLHCLSKNCKSTVRRSAND